MGQNNISQAREEDLHTRVLSGKVKKVKEGFEGRSVCIDLGSGNIKIGFGGDDTPLHTIPTVYGRLGNEEMEEEDEGEEDQKVHQEKKKKYVLGEECLSKSELIGENYSYPIQHGRIQNYDQVESLIRHCYEDLLNIDSKEGPSFVTDTFGSGRRQRERICQMFFEDFSVPAFGIFNQGVLALYASGRTTGHVLTHGCGVTQNVPIYEGYALPHAMSRLNLGGKNVTERLVEILKKNGMPRFQDDNDEKKREYSVDVLAKNIKEKCCYVSLDYPNEKKKKNSQEEENGNKVVHTLPDGSEIPIEGEERYEAPEILFRPYTGGFFCEPMHELVWKSIMKCDADIRKDLFDNIILSGGGTRLKGFGERMKIELDRMVRAQLLGGETFRVEVVDPGNQEMDTWVGSSILSSLSTFSNMWMWKSEYDDCGPSLVQRKFF